MRIGIDLGGTKIEAVALASDGSQVARLRVASPRGNYERTVTTIANLARDLETRLGQRATVGVGIPGTIVASTGRVKNANSTWLNGQLLQEDLSRLLDREVRCANDANCFALSESTDGAGRGKGVVFGVILGTGCGGGIAVDGRVHAGRNGLAGEWGHTPLPWPSADEVPGPACYCGRNGCLETWISGPGLEADYARVAGRRLSSEQIAELALSGNQGATAAHDRLESRIARGLAMVVDILDPDVVVLGGGLSNLPRLWSGSLEQRIAVHTFGGSTSTPVLRNVHGDSSGVRGAAWLWEQENSLPGCSAVFRGC